MKLNEQHWRQLGDNLTISFSNRLKVTGVTFLRNSRSGTLLIQFSERLSRDINCREHKTCCHLLPGEAFEIINLWRNSETFLNLFISRAPASKQRTFLKEISCGSRKSYHESIQVRKFLWESTPQANQHHISLDVLFPLELIFDSCNNIMMKNIRNMRGRVSVKEKLNLLFMVVIICRLAGVWRLLLSPSGPRRYHIQNYIEKSISNKPPVTKLSPET